MVHSKRHNRSFNHRKLSAVLALVIALSLFGVSNASAQGAQGSLAGRAILPAGTLADGPQAGRAFAGQTANALALPFGSQPVGSFTAVVPADYAGAWYALSESVFDSPQNSADYLLRIYTVQIDWRDAGGGAGSATVVDWITLSDPANKFNKQLATANRELSGADFDPRAMRRTSNKDFWIAESSGPSLLHFNRSGQLVEAPIALPDNGALQGLGLLQNGTTLIVAQRSGNGVVIRAYDTQSHAFGGDATTVPLQNGGNVMRGFSMINGTQALAVEEDNRQNAAAQFKQLVLIDFGTNPATVSPLADLLNLVDSSGISTSSTFTNAPDAFGIGNVFKFAFADISSVYAINGQTVLLANNNNVPFGQGRSKSQADDTEFIAVTIPQALQVDGAFAAPR
jgi:hypothetical protein